MRGRRPCIGDAVASSRLLATFTGMRVIMRYVGSGGFDYTTCLDVAEIAEQEFAEEEVAPKREFSGQLLKELAELQRIGTVELIAVDNMMTTRPSRLPSRPSSARCRSAGFRGRRLTL